MKKIFTLAIAFLATLSVSADELWGLNGSGTEADPYQITSAADFTTIAGKISAENTGAGKYFKVINDINFGGSAENPVQLPSIGKAAITSITNIAWGFQGILDGNNKTITGIYHTNNSNDANGKFNALFSSLGEGGVVKNLTLDNQNTINTYNYAAAFVSLNKGGIIENCTNNANITAVSTFAGGISAYICGGKGTISNSVNNGTIKAQAYAAGIVSGSQSGSAVGTKDAAYANIIVSGNVNNGNVSTTNGTGSAGIAGSFSGVLTNNTNTGTIDDSKGTAKSIQYTAGIAACVSYVAGISGNVNKGAVKGGNYVGGIIGCIMKGGNESVDVSANKNEGTIEATGSDKGDILGGSKRDAGLVITAIQSVATSSSRTASTYKTLINGRIVIVNNGNRYDISGARIK